VARHYSVLRERVWDMAIEQFVAPHHGVQSIAAQYSVLKYVINGKIQILSLSTVQT